MLSNFTMDQYLAITNDLLSKLETVYLVKDVDTCMYVIPCCVYFQTIVELLLETECVHSIYSDGLLPSLLLPSFLLCQHSYCHHYCQCRHCLQSLSQTIFTSSGNLSYFASSLCKLLFL